jgi:hypothetical protein
VENSGFRVSLLHPAPLGTCLITVIMIICGHKNKFALDHVNHLCGQHMQLRLLLLISETWLSVLTLTLTD